MVQITKGPPLRQTTLFHSTEAPLDLYSSRDFLPIYKYTHTNITSYF